MLQEDDEGSLEKMEWVGEGEFEAEKGEVEAEKEGEGMVEEEGEVGKNQTKHEITSKQDKRRNRGELFWGEFLLKEESERRLLLCVVNDVNKSVILWHHPDEGEVSSEELLLLLHNRGHISKQVQDRKNALKRANLLEWKSKLNRSYKCQLNRVDKDTFFKSRYLFFPLIDHAKWHWFLLVVDVTGRSIKHYNSLWPRNFHDSLGQAVVSIETSSTFSSGFVSYIEADAALFLDFGLSRESLLSTTSMLYMILSSPQMKCIKLKIVDNKMKLELIVVYLFVSEPNVLPKNVWPHSRSINMQLKRAKLALSFLKNCHTVFV